MRTGLTGRVPDDDLDDLILALNEAATNAVLHGSGAGHPVEIVVRLSGEWAEMIVLDRGPVQRPPRGWYDDDSEEQAPVSGRGLWLMGSLVDEVRLERIQPQGTRVTLRRRVGNHTGNGVAADPRTA